MAKNEEIKTNDVVEEKVEVVNESDLTDLGIEVIAREYYSEKQKANLKEFVIVKAYRGFEFEAHLVPKVAEKETKVSSYDFLEKMFALSEKVTLCTKPYEMVDEATGQVNRGVTYWLKSNDDIFEPVPVKPINTGDKSALKTILRICNVKL